MVILLSDKSDIKSKPLLGVEMGSTWCWKLIAPKRQWEDRNNRNEGI